jgi:hypothetical protein
MKKGQARLIVWKHYCHFSRDLLTRKYAKKVLNKQMT